MEDKSLKRKQIDLNIQKLTQQINEAEKRVAELTRKRTSEYQKRNNL